eukprot:TRINITY_DN27833_c0_g1_i1.p1 TRINITY_DN27833_c0_g1~~TRINITY_DN27833_c0_g1_i1.p1  ORF type:complete len:187 (+),score=31.63 TRINITY_DN27833_c0_g1_i1:58-618(+)
MGACCNAPPQVVPDPPSLEEVLTDVTRAEGKLWKIAFSTLDTDKLGRVPTNNELLRVYLMEASDIGNAEAVDRELLRLSADGFLTFESFSSLLTQNVLDETVSLLVFQQTAQNDEKMPSMDARTALRGLGESKLGAVDWDELLWDRVLDVVMHDAAAEVDMEWWLSCCQMFARYVRAVRQQKNPII